MKPKSKIVKLVVLTVLGNLFLVNFAFAQLVPKLPSTTPKDTTVLINPGEYQEINNKKLIDKCNNELSERLWKIPFSFGLFGTGLTFKVPVLGEVKDKIWLVARWDDTSGCTIYQKTYMGAFSSSKDVNYYLERGYKVETETGFAKTTTGSYYLVRTAFAEDVQAILANVSKPFTVDNFVNRYQNSDFDGAQEASVASKLIGWVLNAVLSVVNAFILMLTALTGKIFTVALHWILHASLPQAITTGWTIVRDICNMFFILILIVIGLGTILRVKEYSEYGHLLGELVLMAILVNFSKVIATTLIDFVNVLISIFAVNFHFRDAWTILYGYVNFGDLGSLPNGWMSGMVQGLSKLLFSFVGLATFIALTGLLVIRVVTLYILIILSPLAYALNILPVTHHYAKEWWTYFIKNLIWVPVALLVMDIGILLARDQQFQTESTNSAFNIILVMAFFWGAVIAAEHMGAAGGKMIAGMAENTLHKFGDWAGEKALHYAGRKWNEKTTHWVGGGQGQPTTRAQRIAFAILNPVATYKGASKRSEELSHHAQEEAIARGREGADLVFSGATLPHAQIVRRTQENATLKSIIGMRKEQLADLMVKFENMKGHEGEVMRNAAITAMLANGFTDDVKRMKHFADKYGEMRPMKDENDQIMYEKDAAGNDLMANGQKVPRMVVDLDSPTVTHRFLYGYGAGPEKHMTEQTMRIISEDAEKFAKDTGHPEIGGHGVFDTDNAGGGAFISTMRKGSGKVKNRLGEDMDELQDGTSDGKFSQRDLILGEWAKFSAQQIMNTAPHGVNPQVAELKPSIDASGNVILDNKGSVVYNYTEDGKMVSNSVFRASPDISPGSQPFYRQMAQMMGNPKTMLEFRRGQDRIADAMMQKIDSQGRLIFNNRSELRKLKLHTEDASTLIKALYAQKLGIDQNNRDQVPSIKYVVKGGDTEFMGFDGKTTTAKWTDTDLKNWQNFKKPPKP